MLFIIGLFKSTALYGIFCLLVGLLGFHISISELFQIAFHPSGFKEYFLVYMFWSPAFYVVIQVINYFCLLVFNKRYYSEFHFFDGMLGRFIASITNPWSGLVTLIGAYKVINGDEECTGWFWVYCWFQVILHFLWSVALLGFIGFGFYSLIR